MGNTDLTTYETTELADEKQIQIEFEGGIDPTCVYDVRGKKQLSYRALKTLALKMSQAGQPLEIIDYKIELVKFDEEDKSQWHWQSLIKMKNTHSGYETIGASEQSFFDERSQYDKFGRNKALSKAERNAIRKQVPEVEIEKMLNEATGDQVKQVGSNDHEKPPSEKQLQLLRDLKYEGMMPKSLQGASVLIDKLIKEQNSK